MNFETKLPFKQNANFRINPPLTHAHARTHANTQLPLCSLLLYQLKIDGSTKRN